MTSNRPSEPLDPFEEDLRRALSDAVRDPAPERLVARVAVIPRTVAPSRSWFARVRGEIGLGGSNPGTEAPTPRRSGLPGLPGLGAAAFGLVVIVAAVALLRPSGGPSVGGPTASAPASAAASPSATGPGETPGASSGAPTTSPGSTAAPGPVGGPIPAGFTPVSVTFASADEGWVLGSTPCTGGPPCAAAIARTTDGGRTWASIPAPTTGVQSDAPADSTAVSRLRFADPLDGWAFGPALFATHDGGATWTQAAIPGTAAGAEVMALETAAGRVHAAVFDPGTGVVRIATSPVGSDAWTISSVTVPVGAGPVPRAQLVLAGTAGWLVEVDRTVVGGARLVGGEWRAWTPPCLDANGPALLAAAGERDLVAACDVGLWSTPRGIHAYASADGGDSFSELPSKPPLFGLDAVAATGTPGSRDAVVAGSLSGVGSALVASFDGGRTWTAVHTVTGAGSFTDLGFTTNDQGVVIAEGGPVGTSGAADARLLMTRDGGRTWAAVAFGG